MPVFVMNGRRGDKTMEWIEVTDQEGNKVFINPDHVLRMSETKYGTQLVFTDDALYVKETPEEILKK
jgi:hypothetical protein